MSDPTDQQQVPPVAEPDPWAMPAAQPADEPGNPWGTADSSDSGSDWLDSAAEPAAQDFDWLNPFAEALIPFDHWVEVAIDWLVINFRPAFQAIRVPIDVTLGGFEAALQGIPAPLMVLIMALLAWQFAGVRLAAGAAVSLVFVGLIGAWQSAMVTLALVLTAVFFCVLIGLPMGIWLARSETATRAVRPMLDAMQTTPAFVYLVPIVMLFGIGNVPGVVVTIIFALPPVIRLTSLGIQHVPSDLIEAANAFGASPRQLLLKVQLPLAMPSIMAGINQTLMLSLSMVVIASMIAVGGLGQMVLRGIGRLDMGLAATGGIGIVILAIILDRLTQSLGRDARARGTRHWYQSGPAALLLRLFKPSGSSG